MIDRDFVYDLKKHLKKERTRILKRLKSGKIETIEDFEEEFDVIEMVGEMIAEWLKELRSEPEADCLPYAADLEEDLAYESMSEEERAEHNAQKTKEFRERLGKSNPETVGMSGEELREWGESQLKELGKELKTDFD